MFSRTTMLACAAAGLLFPAQIAAQTDRGPQRTSPASPAQSSTAPVRTQTRTVTPMAMTTGPLYALPFKGEDFGDSDRVYWHRPIHSESGVQKHGYDLDVRRYDDSAKQWKATKSDGQSNSDWYVSGMPVYAMRDGKVIACWRNAPENLKSGTGEGNWHEELTKYPGDGTRIYGGGNGFWIEHDDGTRAEYAHFQPGTVPASLCPHNAALLPEVIPSPTVANAWKHIRVTAAQQKTVKAGQFLGRAGNSGTSSNPHLHIHVEKGGVAAETKSGGEPVETNFRSGLYIPHSASSGPFVEWKSFAGKPIPPGPILFWPSRTAGGEYARHGFDATRFGAFFQHLADSGFWPEWIDAYNVGGRNFLNFVWRPAQGAWRAYFLVNGAKYQEVFNQASADDYAPVFVESSVSGGQPRYTVIFVKNKPGGALARHGLTYEQHMAVMDEAKGYNMSPVNISVISVNGQRRYTVLYRTGNIGSWSVKSQIAESAYQTEYNAQTAAGRKPVYLNAYMHQGQPYISAVFAQIPNNGRKDRHGMSGSAYQSEYESALNAGLSTRAVSAFDGAQSQHRFAAIWWK